MMKIITSGIVLIHIKQPLVKCDHIERGQSICKTNQLIGFKMMVKPILNDLISLLQT